MRRGVGGPADSASSCALIMLSAGPCLAPSSLFLRGQEPKRRRSECRAPQACRYHVLMRTPKTLGGVRKKYDAQSKEGKRPHRPPQRGDTVEFCVPYRGCISKRTLEQILGACPGGKD